VARNTQPPAQPDVHYRVSTVAKNLGLSRSTVYRLVYAGELEAHKASAGRGGALLIPKKSVDDWLARNAWAEAAV
jgi:excisionase family DNA binding protein